MELFRATMIKILKHIERVIFVNLDICFFGSWPPTSPLSSISLPLTGRFWKRPWSVYLFFFRDVCIRYIFLTIICTIFDIREFLWWILEHPLALSSYSTHYHFHVLFTTWTLDRLINPSLLVLQNMTMTMVHGPWPHLTILSHFMYDFKEISSKTSKKMRGKAWMSPGSWNVSAQGIWNNGTQIFWWILLHIRFQVVDCDPSLSNCWVREADVSMISSCAKTKVNFKVDDHNPADTFIYMATFCILFCNHPKINWNIRTYPGFT